MPKNLDRTQQTAVLQRAQEKRKQEKREKVFKAIQEIQKAGGILDFPSIAKHAGCSVSYLYKWPEIKAYIHGLQEHEPQQIYDEETKTKPNSLKSLQEILKQRIRELQKENQELKRQNEQLRGHVVEIFELRDECKRLQTRVQELTAPPASPKVLPLRASNSLSSQQNQGNIPKDIIESINSMGINLGVRLQQEICRHTPEKVMLAIEAFQQYRNQTTVSSPGACLLTMIRDEAEPNVLQKAVSTKEEEFDCWYNNAVKNGFCLDIPKNHLGSQGGELVVKVKTDNTTVGYEPMPWKKAQRLLEKGEFS
jgi:myosin heavy subunit